MGCKEYRIFGPPGTGKTRNLVFSQIPAAVKRFGADGVVACSFSKAASLELLTSIRESGLDINHRNVGTLHAIAHRARLDKGGTIYTKKIKLWNVEHPNLLISGGADTINTGEISIAGHNPGGDLLGKTSLFRNKIPLSILH